MAYQLSFDNVEPNTTITIRGKVTYSHIAKLIDGEELIRENERKKQQMASIGKPFYENKPHTQLAIKDVQIIPNDPNGQLNLAEQTLQERFYIGKGKDNENSVCYSADSYFIPQVFERTTNGVNQVILPNELASGLTVTLFLNVYKPKNNPKHGIGLNAVVAEEPIRYFGNNGINDVLTKMYGSVTYNASTPSETNVSTEPVCEQPQPQTQTVPTQPPVQQQVPPQAPPTQPAYAQPQITQTQPTIPVTQGGLVNPQIDPNNIGGSGIHFNNNVIS